MNPHGILFKGQMIEALLNTQPDVWLAKAIDPMKPSKWQTRRELDPQPPEWARIAAYSNTGWGVGHERKNDWCFNDLGAFNSFLAKCPHPVGTILYAKETWRTRLEWDKLKPTELPIPELENQDNYDWCQDEFISYAVADKVLHQFRGKKRTAMFMRPWMSRLWFEVMRVRVHRVNTISEFDAEAEGVAASKTVEMKDGSPCYTTTYQTLWNQINGCDAWEKNPWVFAYDLKRITRPKL